MKKTINSTTILEPNYRITIATMDELCSWFKQFTGSWASIEEIKKSFNRRQKKKIYDGWMKRWYEAIDLYGPMSNTARIIDVHNKVPLIGRTEIAKALIGQSASIEITHVAVGS
jgi:hypothetical protein